MTVSAESIEGYSTESAPRGHTLAPGVQVRAETKGLLFYSMNGPRLFFLGSDDLLGPDYFQSGLSLDTWLNGRLKGPHPEHVYLSLLTALDKLVHKGVLLAD